MSKKDMQRYLRSLVCDGCSKHCRYADFRVYGRYAGGFAPQKDRGDRSEEYKRYKLRKQGVELPHGNKGRKHKGQQEFAAELREIAAASKEPFGKGRILGSMHELKMRMWLEYTENCPSRE